MVTTIDQKIAEFFNNWQPGGWPWGNMILCTIAILLSVILCGSIGFEREKRGHSAGLRTHLLVGVGSTVIMIISIYGFPAIFTDKGGAATRDVARLAAGVIAGVGFLGAGAIIHNSGSAVKGLTTASTIWMVMAIGLACGSMNFVLALGVALVSALVLTFFRGVERKINSKSPQISIIAPADVPAVSNLLLLAKKYDLTLHDLDTQLLEENGQSNIQIIFKINSEFPKDVDLSVLIQEIRTVTHATSVQVMNNHR